MIMKEPSALKASVRLMGRDIVKKSDREMIMRGSVLLYNYYI